VRAMRGPGKWPSGRNSAANARPHWTAAASPTTLSSDSRKVAPTTLGPRFLSDVVASLQRLAAGYALACAAGIALGVPIGISPALRRALEPVLPRSQARTRVDPTFADLRPRVYRGIQLAKSG
jgi:hypothetical protein